MKWSQEQTQDHRSYYERFRQAYVDGGNKTTSVEDITNCRARGITLVNNFTPLVRKKIDIINQEMANQLPGFYFQHIPHFTIDCHRYLTEEQVPEEIGSETVLAQKYLVISPEELRAYDSVLRKEPVFDIEVMGISIGGDGLVAQVWYDDQRMIDFTERLGERVRRKVPSMDFQWGMIKRKVPARVVNLTRFTGDEDRSKVLEFVDDNRDREFGGFKTWSADLLFSDHYVQGKNTSLLELYHFSD